MVARTVAVMSIVPIRPLRRGAVPGGLAVAFLSAAAFGVAGTLATSLLRSGWTPGAAVAARLVVAVVALAVPAWRSMRGHWSGLRGSAPTVAAYGLLAVAGAQLCYFQAIQHLSVAVALLLEYSGTLLVVAWMWARHHQVPSRVTAMGAVLAMAGLVLVLDLTGDHHLDVVGILWGLGAAIGLAAYFIVSADADEPLPPLAVAWGGLAVGAAAIVLAAAVGALRWRAPLVDVTLAHSRVSWLVPVLAIGVVAAALAYATGIIAARVLGARMASFVGLAEVLCAAIYARALLGERLAPVQMLGGLLVLAGIAVVRAGEPATAAPVVEMELLEPAA